MKKRFQNLFDLGLRHIEKKNYALALECFTQVSRFYSNHCGAWGNIGFCLRNLDRYNEAIKAYKQLTSRCPEYMLIGEISIGECELSLGNLESAAKLIDDILRKAPDLPEAWIAASNYYSKTGNYEMLKICSEKAVALNPGLAVAHLNRGWALLNMEDYSEALTATSTALKLDNSCIDALINASTIHLQTGKHEASIAMATKALLLQANCIDAMLNIAKALKEQGSPHAGISMLDRLNVENSQTLLVRSDIFNDIGETDAAIQCLQRAISYYNGSAQPELLHSLGTLLLKKGEFSAGFKLYEYRKKLTTANQYNRGKGFSTDNNICQLHLKTLVTKEQGIGDNILFASLLPEILLDQGSIVHLEADSRLHNIYKRSFGRSLRLIENNVSPNQIIFDEIISIGSLGRAFRSSTEDFRRQAIGYLKADQQESRRIRRELTNNTNACKIIGISWFSAGLKRQNRKKCIGLRKLIQAIEGQQDYFFVNLQYDWKDCSREDKSLIAQMPNIYTPDIDLRNDLDGVASYLDACDAIITVSTSLAHLACALGKETNVLLPLSAIWHWGSEPEKTVWYPRAKLYRQKELDNWEDPLARLSHDLRTRWK